VLGLGYYSISIEPDGGGTFLSEPPGNSGRMSSDEIEDAAAAICRGWHPDPTEVRRRLIELLAGPSGSYVFDGIWSGDGTDRYVASCLAGTIGHSNEDKQKLLADCQEQALTLVRREWPAISALAQCLLASPNGRLVRDEIIVVLHNYGVGLS